MMERERSTRDNTVVSQTIVPGIVPVKCCYNTVEVGIKDAVLIDELAVDPDAIHVVAVDRFGNSDIRIATIGIAGRKTEEPSAFIGRDQAQ